MDEETAAMMAFYEAWKARAQANEVARMRFAGLRFVVYCRRKAGKGVFNIRRTMGFDECRI